METTCFLTFSFLGIVILLKVEFLGKQGFFWAGPLFLVQDIICLIISAADSDRKAKSVGAIQFLIDADNFCSENRQAPFIQEVALNSTELLPTAY